MDRSIYVAMSGAKELFLAQEGHNNNLANLNTQGFLADRFQQRAMPVFGDVLATRVQAMTESPALDLAPGPLTPTGRDMDVAMSGRGWISVLGTDGGESFVRSASLQVTPAGQMVTESGRPVLGNFGPIALPPFQRVSIAPDGTISIVPQGQTPEVEQVVDRIKMVDPPPNQLRKAQDGTLQVQNRLLQPADAGLRLTPMTLQGSNVSGMGELVALLEDARRYEMHVRFLSESRDNEGAGTSLLRLGG
jgi:flagellar basal-body rod protein FlgF